MGKTKIVDIELSPEITSQEDKCETSSQTSQIKTPVFTVILRWTLFILLVLAILSLSIVIYFAFVLFLELIFPS